MDSFSLTSVSRGRRRISGEICAVIQARDARGSHVRIREAVGSGWDLGA